MSLIDQEIMDLDSDDFVDIWMKMTEDERQEVQYQIDRQYVRIEDPTPGNLALRLDPMMVQTPALELIDNELIGIRDAIEVMFARRKRFAELVRGGMHQRTAAKRVSEEIPSK